MFIELLFNSDTNQFIDDLNLIKHSSNIINPIEHQDLESNNNSINNKKDDCQDNNSESSNSSKASNSSINSLDNNDLKRVKQLDNSISDKNLINQPNKRHEHEKVKNRIINYCFSYFCCCFKTKNNVNMSMSELKFKYFKAKIKSLMNVTNIIKVLYYVDILKSNKYEFNSNDKEAYCSKSFSRSRQVDDISPD